MFFVKPNYLKLFEKEGFVVMKNVVPKPLLNQLQEKIDNLEYIQGDDWHPSYRFKHVFNRETYWLDWIDLQEPLMLAEAILGEDCHIIAETAWKSVPGHLGSPCHVDYIPNQLNSQQVSAFTWPTFIITAHFFPHLLTEELGPTQIIPKSHLFGGNYQHLPLVSVLPQPGDCLLFRSDLFHAGKPNTTLDQNRYLLQVHYAQRWIAQRWAQPGWTWNESILNSANPTQLRLLGKHSPSNYD